jgi:DNA repair exonuclease SbcCD ATPase subunit
LNRDNSLVKEAFETIREELDDYRETINQNTNEIQSNYEYLCKLDEKIDKLSERIDEICMFLNICEPKKNYSIQRLTTREKEVFSVLYASASVGITHKDIARKTGLSDSLVICYVSNLVQKGVPLMRKFLGGEMILYLEDAFRETQAKENIAGLSQAVIVN